MLMKSFKAVFYPIKTLLDKNYIINHNSINTDLNAAPTKQEEFIPLTLSCIWGQVDIYKVVQKNKEYIFLI